MQSVLMVPAICRKLMLAVVGAALSFCLVEAVHAANVNRPPNVLLVAADDLGCQLSCYGERRFRTPQLDALAAEGVRFERFYVAQSSCSSSRAALLTGLWPHQNGQVGLAHPGFRMHRGQKTLPALLKAARYYNGIIGKLHVQPEGAFPFDWRAESAASTATRRVRWVAEQSRHFFAAARTSGQPFFYYVNFFDPHGPYTPDVDQVEGVPEKPVTSGDVREPYAFEPCDEAAGKQLTATITNTILRVDAGVGLLLDELKSAGLAENTLVMFLGDNGLPVRRGKTTSYEAGVHVPLLVRWPGVVAGQQVRSELTAEVDILPTILAAAGVVPPAGLEGQPLQPLLKGEAVKWREFLFTEMNFHRPEQFWPQRSVRDDRHKLLLNLAPRAGQAPVELFDLRADPEEVNNLADESARAADRRRLAAALDGWQRRTVDPLRDTARLNRWKDAALRWSKVAPIKVGPRMAVCVPPGDLELLE